MVRNIEWTRRQVCRTPTKRVQTQTRTAHTHTFWLQNLLGSLVCSTGFFIIEWLNHLGLISSVSIGRAQFAFLFLANFWVACNRIVCVCAVYVRRKGRHVADTHRHWMCTMLNRLNVLNGSVVGWSTSLSLVEHVRCTIHNKLISWPICVRVLARNEEKKKKVEQTIIACDEYSYLQCSMFT